ncbi:hypothetical protein E4U42_003408 [Claviceps africana]|uniref:Uncharacterized protein n=1 Tax=Claviceps africana TaxID=83212 RepID=A0A8K0NHV1_9HYPO|nr:hypothetical protein E4U42_003408 [Claviceps africana]
MKLLLPLLSLSVLVSSLPAWHQGPIISDDDNLMERRDLYMVEVVRAHSSCHTHAVMAKITKYASDAQGYLAASFKGVVADGNDEVMPTAMGRITRHRHNRHGRHRISLSGFRNRLALVILAFAVVLAVACSYLRRTYIASSRRQSSQGNSEPAFSEKALSRTTEKDVLLES